MRYLFCLLVVLSSCGQAAYFSETTFIPETGWSYTDNLSATISIPDTANVFDLVLSIKHSEAYDYQNLYLKTETIFPNQDTVEDVISIPFVDEEGYWYGKGSSEKQFKSILQENFKFLNAGDHTINLYQHSRDEVLQGITEVGLELIEK